MKFGFFFFLGFFAFLACNNREEIVDTPEDEVVSVNFLQLRSAHTTLNINEVVDNYVANLEDVFYGVESFITYKNGLTHVITENNPIDSMFGHFDIEDTESHAKLSVFNMGTEELNTFIKLYLNNEKEYLQGMLAFYPELAQNLEKGNQIHEQVKAALGRGGTRLSSNIVSYKDYNTALKNVIELEINGGIVPKGDFPPATMDWTCPYCGRIFPVQDPSLLATEGATHIGKPYSSWVSFGWSKARAPHSFQCASLVWYCAKEAYGCQLASFLSLTVTPANIFFDRNSYIKKRIIVKPKNT